MHETSMDTDRPILRLISEGIFSLIKSKIKSPLQRPLWINPDDGWTFARDQNWQPVHNWLKSIVKENSLFSTLHAPL